MGNVASSENSKPSRLVLWSVGVLALLFLIFLEWLYIWPAVKAFRSHSWRVVPATIETVGRFHRYRALTTEAHATFTYTFNGVSYKSAQAGFWDKSVRFVSDRPLDEWLRVHIRGAPTTCYVDPADPSDAVLDRRYSEADIAWGIGVPVTYFLIALWIHKTSRSRKEKSRV